MIGNQTGFLFQSWHIIHSFGNGNIVTILISSNHFRRNLIFTRPLHLWRPRLSALLRKRPVILQTFPPCAGSYYFNFVFSNHSHGRYHAHVRRTPKSRDALSIDTHIQHIPFVAKIKHNAILNIRRAKGQCRAKRLLWRKKIGRLHQTITQTHLLPDDVLRPTIRNL